MKSQKNNPKKAAYTEADYRHACNRIENIINKHGYSPKAEQHIFLRAKRITKAHKAAAYVEALIGYDNGWATRVENYFTIASKF